MASGSDRVNRLFMARKEAAAAASQGNIEDIKKSLKSDGNNQENEQDVPFKLISLDRIMADPDQPRQNFKEEKINELAESINARGVLQPIRVIPIEDSKYMLVAGERRWRAAQKAGLQEIPAVVVDNKSKFDRLIDGLVENIQRDNLSALEKADSIRKIQELNPHFSDTVLAKTIGISRMMLYRLMNIHKLPDHILSLFEKENLNDRHAKALLMLADYSQLQEELLSKIIEEKLSGPEAIKQAEEFLSNMSGTVKKTVISKYYNNIMTATSQIEKKISKVADEEEKQVKQQLADLKRTIERLEYKINNRG